MSPLSRRDTYKELLEKPLITDLYTVLISFKFRENM